MKNKFTFLIAAFAALMLITLPEMAKGQTKDDTPTTLYSENFGEAGNNTPAYSSYTGYSATQAMFTDNTVAVNTHYSGDGKIGKSTYSAANLSSGYTGASGLSGCFHGGTANTEATIIQIADINIEGYENLHVSFGALGGSTTHKVNVQYKIDDGGFTNLITNGAITNANWTLLEEDIDATGSSLTLKFTHTPTKAWTIRMDDIKVTGTSATPTPTTYTVTFDCDGGEGCPDDMTGITAGDDNFTVPSTTPTKPCYAFDGVYLDGELNEYEPGETYTITGDLELTASWTLNKYNITYQAGEGSGSNYTDANQDCGSNYTIKAPAAVSITAPAAKPYFTGWLGSDDNTYQTGDTYEVSAALTLTAQWTATAVYDVLYDCNGGTANCPSDASYEENTTIQLPAAPTYADHTFNGWLCSADLETYAAGADYTITEDVEFEAQWLENLAAPTITIEGVSNGTANTYYATVAITITAASGATIYYTTDGTNPTTGSTVYSASFNVTTTGENTVKAIAVKAGNGNSSVSSLTFTIVQPNEATFTNGVYSSLANASSSDFNTWYAYDKTGSQSWSWSSYSGDYFAKMSGYVSSTNYANEDWLVSPKMLVENGKLKLSFKCATKKGDANTITIKYSTDYPGYGDPTGYTWTNITTTPTINPDNNYTFTEYTGYITGLSNNTNVYVAFKYTSTTTTAGTVEINTFSAKQCYPVIYHANGGSGSTTDADSTYAVGTEVTVVDNTFIAPTEPANMEFDHWNTQDDDEGVSYTPSNNFIMGSSAFDLYAIWEETYTISYSTNGQAEATTTTIYQGDAISGLITPTAANIPAGYTFMGWHEGDYASINTAPTYVKNGDAISGNLELKAVFAVASTDEETVDASLEIIPSDFTSGGYAANDGDHEKSDIKYNTYNVYQQSSSKIQFKSNSGYLYNKTSLNLTSIALSNISQGAFTVYAGTEEHPTTTSISGQNNVYTISDNSYKYFTIKGGSDTPRVGTITVNYTTTASVTTYSNYCTSVTSVTMTEDVTIAGDLNLTYTLTVPSGKTLTVTGDLVNNNVNRLIIEDGGQLICNNSVAATVQKTVAGWTGSKGDADGWYAIASPVNTVAITSFAQDTHNVYRYDEATHFWQEYHNWGGAASEQTLDNGRGYLYRSRTDGIAFAGNTNVLKADYTLSYACDLDNMKGFNLIGNPFTHNIYKGATAAAISNTDDKAVAILENDAYYFDTAKGTWSLLKDGNAIAPTQAILVQATTAATLSIVNSTAGASVGKYANDNIWFTVKNSEYHDDACVKFKEGRGLNKVEHRNDQAPMLYIMHNGDNFASVDMPDNTRAINLGFEAKTMGQYTLSLKAEGQYSYIHLYDKLTGEDIDMLVEDSYSFIGTPSDRKNRFVLNLNYNAAGIDIESDIFAYQSGSEIIVSGEGELQIFDVMGRLVMNQRINGVETVNGINNGVYIFKLEGKTQKIVVR